MTMVDLGSTARSALSIGGPRTSAGKSLIASAPACSKAKASVGLKKPGKAKRPACLAVRTIAVSACGVTISGPPAAATSLTCDDSVKVPAPISIRLPKRRDKMEMLSNGLGELRGTSTIQTPALSNAEQIDSASVG